MNTARLKAELRANWRKIVATMLVIAVVASVEVLLVMAGGVVFALLMTVAFAIGAGLVPIFAYVFMDAIPVLSAGIGQLVFTLGMFGLGYVKLEQQADDTYKIVYADPDDHDSKHWTRLAFNHFGVGYERDPDAFGRAVQDIDYEYLDENSDLAGGRIETEIERGGRRAFFNKRLIPDGGSRFFVNLWEHHAQMRDSASIDIINRVHEETKKEEGGDSSSHSTKTMAAATFAFAFLGMAVGHVMFFF